MAVTLNDTYQGNMSARWAREAYTTLRDAFRDVPELMMRQHPFLTMIEHNGHSEMNVSGAGWSRSIQVGLHTQTATDGTAPRSFAPSNLWRVINCERRSYDITDSISKNEKNANRGDNAVVPVFKKMLSNLKKSSQVRMAEEAFRDGEATGLGLHGVETIFGVETSSTVHQSVNNSATAPSAAGRDVNVLDPFMRPSLSSGKGYLGLNTLMGALGGDQISGIWPFGYANEQFDAYTPLVGNSNSTYHGPIPSGYTGWQANAVDILALMFEMAGRNMGRYKIDMVLMPHEQMNQLKANQRSKERTPVTSNSGTLKSYGFSGGIEIDGVECLTEYGLPTTSVVRAGPTTVTNLPSIYGFPTKAWHLLSAYDSLYDFDPPYYDTTLKAWLFAGDFDGNLWNESVRGSFKVAPYSATS